MANLRLLVIHLRRANACYLPGQYLYIMNKVYEADYDPLSHTLVCKWMGYATSQQFREGMLIQLGMLTAWKCHRMLVDLSEMVLIGREDQEWMDRSYMPTAIQCGLRMVGIVPSHHYFNKVAVESVVFKMDKEKVSVHYHDSVETAKEWFATHPPDMPDL